MVASEGFPDVQALSIAWHSVAGYPSSPLSFAEMVALLDQHPHFAWRCVNTDQAHFFGTCKEILWKAVDYEYRRPLLLRQRAPTIWSKLRLVFVGHREPSCLISGLDGHLLRALAKATVVLLLDRQEDRELHGDARAPWHSLLSHEL